MKLHTTTLTHLNTITACDAEGIDVNRQRYTHSVIVSPDAPLVAWPIDDFAELREADFSALSAYSAEVILLGTGAQQRFVAPQLRRALTQQGIGIECMDTAAACRTYNILMAENRRVVAALIVPQKIISVPNP